jgi:hypothetical protein
LSDFCIRDGRATEGVKKPNEAVAENDAALLRDPERILFGFTVLLETGIAVIPMGNRKTFHRPNTSSAFLLGFKRAGCNSFTFSANISSIRFSMRRERAAANSGGFP